jgi:hypothetical protein
MHIFYFVGVLVHSGIAQGGHYYSFARDPNNPDKWYRFDDEDVTPFNPEHIPTQCFGGPPMNSNSQYEEGIEHPWANESLHYSCDYSPPFILLLTFTRFTTLSVFVRLVSAPSHTSYF